MHRVINSHNISTQLNRQNLPINDLCSAAKTNQKIKVFSSEATVFTDGASVVLGERKGIMIYSALIYFD